MSNSTYSPLVATAWHGPELVAVWPLSLSGKSNVKTISSLGDPFDQYTDLLCEPTVSGEEIVKTIVGALRDNIKADGIVLHKVRANSSIHAMSEIGAFSVDEGNSAPQIHFDTGKPFSDFLSSVKPKTLKNLRNYKNRLSREGHLEHVVLKGPQIAAAISESFSVRRRWLRDTGQTSSGFRHPNFERVVDTLAENNADNLGLVAFALKFNDQMIAIQWGFVHQGCYHAYMSSRDPKFNKYSVGRIHLQFILEECHNMEVSSIDLMVPSVPYKLSWATSIDHVVDFIWPWSMRARIKMGLIERHLKPQLKKLFRHLPLVLQRKLTDRLNAPQSDKID